MDELKAQIQQKTGIPSRLLTAESQQGIFDQARALLKLREDPPKGQTNAEQFADLFRQAMGIDPELQTEQVAALEQIAAGYPIVTDGGEADSSGFPDPRPASEQFADWFRQLTQFNPYS